jgi:methylmalonyl-CoA mutase
MTNRENLFEEFSSISKEEWVEKVKKDLKGKPFSDLTWQLDKLLNIDSFYHPDDEIGDSKIQNGVSLNNDWFIGEDFIVDDPIAVNKKLLAALNNGVNAPRFIFNIAPSPEVFRLLLLDVNPSFIQTHFKVNGGTRDNISLIENYFKYLQTQNINPSDLSGSFHFTPTINEKPESLIAVSSQLFPKFKCLHLLGGENSESPLGLVEELTKIIRDTDELLQQLDEHQVPFIEMSIAVGTSYFVEIAKIRALRILWSNLLKAYEVPDIPPLTIDAYIDDQSFDENVNTNMIRTMTIAMSTVIGGVNRLTILPADQKPNAFTTRIARNVQHLLKMESYMDRVVDPSSGSYYIEKLTKLLVEKTWEKFSAE